MHRHALLFFAAALAPATLASAQSGDLAGVTMRVLDSVEDIDAVILELDASPGAEEEGAAADRDEAARARENERADRPEASVREERRAERDARELHDPAVDERSEGRLEDRDVERPAVPPPPAP